MVGRYNGLKAYSQNNIVNAVITHNLIVVDSTNCLLKCPNYYHVFN